MYYLVITYEANYTYVLGSYVISLYVDELFNFDPYTNYQLVYS